MYYKREEAEKVNNIPTPVKLTMILRFQVRRRRAGNLAQIRQSLLPGHETLPNIAGVTPKAFA